MPGFLLARNLIISLKNGSNTLGNDGCDIILNWPDVEPQHALIQFNTENNFCSLRDLSSSNSTYVNNICIQNLSHVLKDGDRIQLVPSSPALVFYVAQSYQMIMERIASLSYVTPIQPQFTDFTALYPHSTSVPVNTSYTELPALGPSITAWAPSVQQGSWAQANTVIPPKPPMRPKQRPESAGSIGKGRSIVDPLLPNQVASNKPLFQFDERESSMQIRQLEEENKLKSIQINELRQQINDLSEELSKENALNLESISQIKDFRTQLSNSKTVIQSLKESALSEKSELESNLANANSIIDQKKKECEEFQAQLASFETSSGEFNEGLQLQISSLNNIIASLNDKIINTNEEKSALQNELDALNSSFQEIEIKNTQLTEIISNHENLKAENSTLYAKSQEFETLFHKQQSFCERIIELLKQYDLPEDSFQNDQSTLDAMDLLLKKLSNETVNESVQTEAKQILDVLETYANCDLKSNPHSWHLLSMFSALDGVEVSEKLVHIKEILLKIFAREMSISKELENTALDESDKIELSAYVSRLVTIVKDQEELISTQKEEIESLKIEHENGENQLKINFEAVIKESEESQSRLNLQIEQLEEKTKQLEQEVSNAATVIAEKDAEIAAKSTSLNENEAILEEFKNRFLKLDEDEESLKVRHVAECERLSEELRIVTCQLEDGKALIEEKNSTISQLEEQYLEIQQRNQDTLLHKNCMEEEFKLHKEEIRQHSRTIVALEERMIQMVSTIQALEKDRDIAVEERNNIELKYRRKKPPLMEKPDNLPPPRTMQDIYSLEQLVLLLKEELGESKRLVAHQECVIEGLRKDLAGASAQLSDLNGELSEEHKEQLEKALGTVKDQSSLIDQLNTQLHSLCQEVDQSKTDGGKYKSDVMGLKEVLNSLKLDLASREEEIENLKLRIKQERDEGDQRLAIQLQQTKIAEELSGLGGQCKGERHHQIIQRQKQALSELRQRVKLLEQNRPKIPSHDQALGQVALLQRELAELKSQQPHSLSSRDVPEVDLDEDLLMDPTGDVRKGRGMIEAALQKSGRIENAEALDVSEKSYLYLTKILARNLEMERFPGSRTMMHISREEREKLFVEREKDADAVADQISKLYSRLERKEELLNTYDSDLKLLREMERIAEEKQNETMSIAAQLRAKKEEMEFVRESLRRTKEDFEREKRLNHAIKTKKAQYLNQFESPSKGPSKHKCEPADTFGKEAIKKKEENEKLKKKIYEVERLKTELKDKDSQISQLTTKLHMRQQVDVN